MYWDCLIVDLLDVCCRCWA